MDDYTYAALEKAFRDHRDRRTVPFLESDFSSQWALFRGKVFNTNDLTPFYREWEEWMDARDAGIRREAAQEVIDKLIEGFGDVDYVLWWFKETYPEVTK